jgi:hypothetical protein
MPQVKPNKPVVGKLPVTNNIGVRYPRWHAKNPKNAIAVPASVVPTR